MKKILLLALLALPVQASEVPKTKQLIIDLTVCGRTVYIVNVLHDEETKQSILFHGDVNKIMSTKTAKSMLEYSYKHPATTVRLEDIGEQVGVKCA
jgi:hypothetical protein